MLRKLRAAFRTSMLKPPLSFFPLLFILGFMAKTSEGQQLSRLYMPLPLGNASSFVKIPSNWTYADSLVIHPDKPNPLRVFPGTKYMVGKPGEELQPILNAPNFRLKIGYILTPGASATVTLPGGASILLAEGRHVSVSKMSGYTGQPPAQDAGKMAGLRQTLEVDYESNIAGLSGKSRINELKINGIVVQQGQYFNQVPSSSVSILVHSGTIIINAIGYRDFEDRRPLSLTNLTYKIYNDEWNSRTTDLLGQSGNSPVLTFEVAEGKKSYNLVYEGTLSVEENGDYDFTTIYTGAYCQLSINDNVVLDTDQSTSQKTQNTNVRLDRGTYTLKLWYSKLPWANAALGLRVGKIGIRAYDLHARSSLPEPPTKPFIVVSPPTKKAEMVRSFIQLPFENHKRTHCISVGSPEERNFSVDLNRGALLQVWSGKFANTTEMWYERGEFQLLNTQGQNEILSGKSSFARLATPETPWTDSSAVNFLDYRVNEKGELTFRYSLGPSVFKDSINATAVGISRTIIPERNASAGNYVLLAEGKAISLIEKDLYLVDGRYYIKTGTNNVFILRKSGNMTELLSTMAIPVSYSVLW